MISDISQKVYETLTQDATLQGILPDVKDSSNVWELRMPDVADEAKFPLIRFKVFGSPIRSVESLNAFNWFIQLDIIGNEASTSDLWSVYDRVYALLQNQNMSVSSAKALKCRLDFFDTDYDKNTLTTFLLTRWQIWSIENPDPGSGQLS